MSVYTKNGQFWGEFQFENERHRVPLGVPVSGQRPPDLRLQGDVAFERSRMLALVELDKVKEEFLDPKKAADRLSRIHKLATGMEAVQVKAEDLFDVWKNARRRKSTLAPRHVAVVLTVLTRFNAFLGERHAKALDFLSVTPSIAADFMAREEARGISNKTYDNVLITMRAAFRAAGVKAGIVHNPFTAIPKKEDQSIHRKPYSADELEKIIQAALGDPVVGPVIIAAACTGMRREDCVKLRWTSVNLVEGVLRLNARKTGEPLYIPIFVPLRKVLEARLRESAYCFPAAVEMFDRNPDGLNWRLGVIVRGIGASERGFEEVGVRLRKPSVVGFHRFKTTFVTLALDAGVPIDMLRKIVGNTVVDIVLKHYYQPSRNAIKTTLDARLPMFLTGRVVKDPLADLNIALAVLNDALASDWEQRVKLASRHIQHAIKHYETAK